MNKRILVVGEGSYIGNAFFDWVSQYGEKYTVDTVSALEGLWKKKSFSEYDAIFHVAGIARVPSKLRKQKASKEGYYKVNRDLVADVAQKAKSENVRQFIFMSTMVTYGNKCTVITKDTQPAPNNIYGDSKLQAENLLNALEDENFHVVRLRPPAVYGGKDKSILTLISSLSKKTPIFPNYQNRKSMIHIDNLCEFVRLVIDNNESGVFHPQDGEYICTSDLCRLFAEKHHKKIWFTRLFNPFIRIMSKKGLLSRIFGDTRYEQSLSEYHENYRRKTLSDAISDFN